MLLFTKCTFLIGIQLNMINSLSARNKLLRQFKPRPRDPASVNAMKQTYVIVILAYFT